MNWRNGSCRFAPWVRLGIVICMGDDFSKSISGQWNRYMRRGEFQAAWEVSDAGLRSRSGKPPAHLPRHLQNVRCHQGFKQRKGSNKGDYSITFV